MATKVLVPRLGEGVDEVTVTKWLKQVGDSIKELEPLLEVNTDKVDTEIPAPASGTILKIIMNEGSPAKVGELLAIIGQPGESADGVASEPKEAQEKTTSTPTTQAVPQPTVANTQPTGNKELGFISPIVAKVAAEHGIDLSQISG